MSGELTRRGLLAALGALPFLGFLRQPRAEDRPVAPAPPPVARETKRCVLNRCFVAGLCYYDGAELVAEGRVKTGDAVRLAAQPENPYDRYAVELFHAPTGVKLGYVPRTENKHLSRLLRAGFPLAARVVFVEPEAETWQAVKVEVEVIG